MNVLVTGSFGHLGEAMVRTLNKAGGEVLGIDIKPGSFTSHAESITDRGFIKQCLKDAQTVIQSRFHFCRWTIFRDLNFC